MEFRIFRAVHGSAEWRAAVRLRDAVLRAPLGLAFTANELAREADQLHLGIQAGAVLAGVVILVPPAAGAPPTWKLRQMAVLPAHRGHGCGTALARAAEDEVRQRGGDAIVLHAREAAIPFYARLGYRAAGPVFTEVTLAHRLMEKRLA